MATSLATGGTGAQAQSSPKSGWAAAFARPRGDGTPYSGRDEQARADGRRDRLLPGRARHRGGAGAHAAAGARARSAARAQGGQARRHGVGHPPRGADAGPGDPAAARAAAPAGPAPLRGQGRPPLVHADHRPAAPARGREGHRQAGAEGQGRRQGGPGDHLPRGVAVRVRPAHRAGHAPLRPQRRHAHHRDPDHRAQGALRVEDQRGAAGQGDPAPDRRPGPGPRRWRRRCSACARPCG